MNELDLKEPKRQSLVGVGVIFFKNLRIAINVFISVILVQFGMKFEIFGLGLQELGILIAAIFMLISYLQYLRFFFYVEGDKFVIEKGLLSRDKITIPFERIQTVNLNQNLVQQLLNVVAVKIDTAGSAQKELEISALEKSYARELQKFLIQQKEEREPNAREVDNEYDDQTPRASSQTRAENLDLTSKRPLVKLSPKDLMQVGLTQNHLRTGLVLFAVINGYVWQFEEFLLKPFESFLEDQANVLLAQWLLLLPLAILVFLVISVLLSMIQAVLRYYNLNFFVDRRGVQLVSGLLKRSEFQIPVNKIQYLKWKINPLRKLIGLKTIIIKQATTGGTADRLAVKVPGCRQNQLNVVLDEFYPERKESSYYLFKAHPLLFTQLGAWFGLVPAIGLCALAFIDWRLVFTAAVYLPLALFFIFKYYKSVGLAINKDTLITRKGWVFPSTGILKFYKLQNVQFVQSIFQKRRNLASVTFFTAAGSESMPHIPEGEARQIYNYVLYRIESSEKSWM